MALCRLGYQAHSHQFTQCQATADWIITNDLHSLDACTECFERWKAGERLAHICGAPCEDGKQCGSPAFHTRPLGCIGRLWVRLETYYCDECIDWYAKNTYKIRGACVSSIHGVLTAENIGTAVPYINVDPCKVAKHVQGDTLFPVVYALPRYRADGSIDQGPHLLADGRMMIRLEKRGLLTLGPDDPNWTVIPRVLAAIRKRGADGATYRELAKLKLAPEHILAAVDWLLLQGAAALVECRGARGPATQRIALLC